MSAVTLSVRKRSGARRRRSGKMRSSTSPAVASTAITCWTRRVRFHPRCPWGKDQHPPLSVASRQRSAKIAVASGGVRSPAKHPLVLGPTAGCVIRLWPDEAVDRGLVLGEGVETVLAAATRIAHRGKLLQPAGPPGRRQRHEVSGPARHRGAARYWSTMMSLTDTATGAARRQPLNVLLAGARPGGKSSG